MSVLRFFYEWLLVPPATFIAYLLVLPLGLLPLAAVGVAWVGTTQFFGSRTDGQLRTISVYLVGGIAAIYAFLVVGMAVYDRLPIVLREVMRD